MASLPPKPEDALDEGMAGVFGGFKLCGLDLSRSLVPLPSSLGGGMPGVFGGALVVGPDLPPLPLDIAGVFGGARPLLGIPGVFGADTLFGCP